MRQVAGGWSEMVVAEGDACIADGVLFRRGSGWGVVDVEWTESTRQPDFGFSVPVGFSSVDERLDGRSVRVRGTWVHDQVVATRPPEPWACDEEVEVEAGPIERPRPGSLTPAAVDDLVDLQMRGVITEIEHIPHAGAWRHVAYVTDHGYDDEVRALLAPGPVTIAASPWSREAWLGCFAAIERLSHLAGFSDGVHDGIPQHQVWLTRVTAADVALMRAVPREMVRIERLLVKPDSYAR